MNYIGLGELRNNIHTRYYNKIFHWFDCGAVTGGILNTQT
jgi:hypothetical protein